MATRIFTCPSCGHRLRLGARDCGNCYQRTPVINRYPTILGSAIAVAALVAFGVIQLS